MSKYNKLIDSFSNRLNRALQIRNMKPIELSRETGISKASISCYMSGKYKAKQEGLLAIANSLNVSIFWLMGFDEPIGGEKVNE